MRKTVVVTGGNRGIGRSITQSFVAAGYSVVVGARSENDVESLSPGRVRFVRTDVREPEAHQLLTATAEREFGGLGCYINNAGYSDWRPIELIDAAFLDDMLATNLKGAFWGCKAAAAALPRGGTIINISSIASKRGSANNAAYCASKFGMNGLTQALAKELGPRGIRVNALCPVLIMTEGLREALLTKYAPAQGDADAFLVNFAQGNTALGRLPTGVEVGAAAVYLASEGASAITAQCINVDCGVFPQ